MTIEEFKEFVKTGLPIDMPEAVEVPLWQPVQS